ncbi:MAG TPA: hypothetical protein VGL42_16405 [Opitutaceae bacterium]
MNFLRGLLRWLILALFILGCLAALLFVPSVQTEAVQLLLGHVHHRVKITVDEVNAGLNSAHLEGVHILGPGFELTAPVVDLELSMPDFLLHRRARLRNVVARDWKASGLEPALALTGASLPWEVSIDHADLAGQLWTAPSGGKGSIPLDVALKGGGVTPSQNGTFALDASGVFVTNDMSQVSAALHGTLSLGLGDHHAPTQINATLTTSGAGFEALSGLTVMGQVGSNGIRWGLIKGGRELVALDGSFTRGRWSLAVTSADVAPFFGDTPPPPFTASGKGDFQWNAQDKSVDLAGELTGVANAWPYTARFTAQHRGHDLAVQELSGTVAGVAFTALQSMSVDETTRAVTYAKPTADLVRVSLDHFALSRVPAWPILSTQIRASAGGASGEIVVSGKGDQGYALRTARPVEVEGAVLDRGSIPWVSDVSGRFGLEGTLGPDQWEIKATELALRHAGKPVLAGSLSLLRSTAGGEPWMVTGKVSTPLPVGGLGPMKTTVNFTGLAGTGLKLDGDLHAVGEAKRDLTATFHLSYDETGSAQLQMPLKLAFGDQVSDLVIDATRLVDQNGERRYLKIAGTKAIRDQLQMLAAPLLANLSAGRPFWGPGFGRLGITVDRFEFPGGVWAPLDAEVTLSPTHVELEDVRVGLDSSHTVKVTGGVDFDPAAAVPYSMTGSLELNNVESAPYFPKLHGEPVVQGKFTVRRTLTSHGHDLAELLAHPLQSIHATSGTSLVRALAVNVGDAVPQHRTSAGQAAGHTAENVASFIFATKSNPLEQGKNPVTPKAEAVLNFTDLIDELDFDHLTVDAAEQPDGSYVVSKIDGSTDEIKVSGSGKLGGKATDKLSDRPLSMDFKVSFRGDFAKLLERGGVVKAPPDKKTWVDLPGPVHLGGTVGNIDPKQWHDLLAPFVRG